MRLIEAAEFCAEVLTPEDTLERAVILIQWHELSLFEYSKIDQEMKDLLQEYNDWPDKGMTCRAYIDYYYSEVEP